MYRWLRLSGRLDDPDCRDLPRGAVLTSSSRRVYQLQPRTVWKQCWHDDSKLQRQLRCRSVLLSWQYGVFTAVGFGDDVRVTNADVVRHSQRVQRGNAVLNHDFHRKLDSECHRDSEWQRDSIRFNFLL